MIKIEKLVEIFTMLLIVVSFICVGTSFEPVAPSSANSESQAAASPFHPTGLLPTQTPSQPDTNRPLFHPTDNEAAICGVGYHYDDGTGTCLSDSATERPICQEGYHFDNYAGTCVPDSQTTQPDSQSCFQSGGHVVTQMCCKSTPDFSNTCVIGPCGCSPDNSKVTQICECEAGKCFDGTACVNIQNDDAAKCEQNPGCVWVNGNCKCPDKHWCTGTISGHVYDIDTATPIAHPIQGAILNPVNFCGTDIPTDRTGYYEIVPKFCSLGGSCPKSEYTITCSANGYEAEGRTVTTDGKGNYENLNFWLRKACAPEGYSCKETRCCPGLTCEKPGICQSPQPCVPKGYGCDQENRFPAYRCCPGLICGPTSKCVEKPQPECQPDGEPCDSGHPCCFGSMCSGTESGICIDAPIP
jgi:hypothetical protein